MKRSLFVILIFFIPFLNGLGQPFIHDVNKFIEQDRLNPPPQNAILFIGSSSFTMWYDLQEQFTDYVIINRAIGGSTLEDQIRYVNDIVFPHSPKQIVIYCGENDFASSDTITVDIVTLRFITLFNLITERLPNVMVAYVSMKPSPSRWHLANKFMAGNNNIKAFLESKPNTSYINIWEPMLNKMGVPEKSIFLEDMLHMNKNGYEIWKKEIQPHLLK